MPKKRSVLELLAEDPNDLSLEDLERVIVAEQRGEVMPGELPFHVEMRRQKALDSPAYMATDVLDPWYGKNFENPWHYDLMDDILGPWLIGEDVRYDGSTYNPKDYTGILVLASRSTIKSAILRMMVTWIAPYRKIREKRDARTMLCHQVLEKAIEHSEVIRNIARHNATWRETFPEFRGPTDSQWDTKAKWRWPCFSTYQAQEFSLMCYGETSSKTGGHYTERCVDDWVTEESVTTELQLTLSEDRFRAMDNLRDRSLEHNPWMCVGTHYHFQDTYKRLENKGGWLVIRRPAHTGSPKRIFEICSIEDRTPVGRRKIEAKLRKLEKEPVGDLNYPHLLPWRELYRSARAQGPHQYNCQLLLNPVPEGEQRFAPDAIDEMWTDDYPSSAEMWLYVRCDPAISTKKTADECSIIVGGVKWDGSRHLIDGWVGREKRPHVIVRKLFTFGYKWQKKGYRVRNIGIEAVQYQEALAQICRDGVPERNPEYHGESVPMLVKPCAIRSIQRSTDMRKQERILEMDGPVARRELKIWKECSVGQRLTQQFIGFPFDKDDLLDATHDLWVGTMTPPREMPDELPPLHPELMKLLRQSMAAKTPTLRGTNNTVRLSTWGR